MIKNMMIIVLSLCVLGIGVFYVWQERLGITHDNDEAWLLLDKAFYNGRLLDLKKVVNIKDDDKDVRYRIDNKGKFNILYGNLKFVYTKDELLDKNLQTKFSNVFIDVVYNKKKDEVKLKYKGKWMRQIE